MNIKEYSSDKELVSVVLPVHNGETYLRDAIESILNQSYRKLELIVVNDCSTDGSKKIVEEFMANDNRVRLINNEINLRLPASLNVGFAATKGEYLTWTSDDNILYPNMIQKLVSGIKSGYDFVYADTSYIDGDGNRMDIISNRRGSIWKANIVGACFLYTRNVYETIGEYDTTAFLVEDYDYWIRVSLKFTLKYLDEELYSYRVHQNSLSGSKKNEIIVATINQLKKYVKMEGMDKDNCNKIREQLVHYYYHLGWQKELREELHYIKVNAMEQYNDIDKVLKLNQYLPKDFIEKMRALKNLI